MNSIKAIISGSSFIIIAILVMQLAYLFIIVGLNNLSHDYPFLNNISGTFGYLFTLISLFVIMFMGGYLTALIADNKKLLHALIVALIVVVGMMLMALENANLTLNGILINGLMLIITLFGAFLQKKKSSKAT